MAHLPGSESEMRAHEITEEGFYWYLRDVNSEPDEDEDFMVQVVEIRHDLYAGEDFCVLFCGSDEERPLNELRDVELIGPIAKPSSPARPAA